MKKNIALLVFAMVSLGTLGQSNFIGMWEGKVNAGIEVKVVFTIRQDESQKFTATMDIPGQGIKGIVANDVVISNDSLLFTIKEFGGTYAGRQVDNITIIGEWKQGLTTALRLKKIEKMQTIQRPQTPVPGFNIS